MKSLSKPGMALVLAATLFATSITPASADYYWWRRHRGGGGAAVAAGVVAGVIGLGILGAAARDRYYNDRYYYGPGYPPPPGYVPNYPAGYAPNYGPNCRPGPVECHAVSPPCFRNQYGDQICPAPERSCAERPICN